MRRVATAAAFRLHRNVFIDKRARFIHVTLRANRIAAGHGSQIADGRGAVYVVAIATPDQSLIDSVVIWLCEVRLSGGVASVTEIGLCAHQQVLRLLGMVR